jgi:predicted ribosome quality control (RQC) complex YloA/Tae2 family protein
LLTKNGAASQNVHQEVGIAMGLDKPVIPLVEEGVGVEALAMLNGIEYVPFDRNAPSEALTALTAVLHRLVQHKYEEEVSRYQQALREARADAQALTEAEERRRQQQRELMMALAVVGALLLIAMLSSGS